MKKLSSKQRAYQIRRNKKRFPKELKRKAKRLADKRAYRLQEIKLRRKWRRIMAEQRFQPQPREGNIL